MHHATRHALLQYVMHCCKIAGRRKLLCWMDGAGYRIIISGDNHVCMWGGGSYQTARLFRGEERELIAPYFTDAAKTLLTTSLCKSPPHSFIGTYFILFSCFVLRSLPLLFHSPFQSPLSWLLVSSCFLILFISSLSLLMFNSSLPQSSFLSMEQE